MDKDQGSHGQRVLLLISGCQLFRVRQDMYILHTKSGGGGGEATKLQARRGGALNNVRVYTVEATPEWKYIKKKQ